MTLGDVTAQSFSQELPKLDPKVEKNALFLHRAEQKKLDKSSIGVTKDGRLYQMSALGDLFLCIYLIHSVVSFRRQARAPWRYMVQSCLDSSRLQQCDESGIIWDQYWD